jgi:hypothetical protein
LVNPATGAPVEAVVIDRTTGELLSPANMRLEMPA